MALVFPRLLETNSRTWGFSYIHHNSSYYKMKGMLEAVLWFPSWLSVSKVILFSLDTLLIIYWIRSMGYFKFTMAPINSFFLSPCCLLEGHPITYLCSSFLSFLWFYFSWDYNTQIYNIQHPYIPLPTPLQIQDFFVPLTAIAHKYVYNIYIHIYSQI